MYISQVIPARVAIKAAVVHMPKQTELVRCPLDDVSGFDLTRFSTFCPDASEPCCLQFLQHTVCICLSLSLYLSMHR